MRVAAAAGALVVAFVVLSPFAGVATAANPEEAKAYVEKARTAFALNRYAVAAENFVKAYELAPDPALLYNAAQSYRLAGDKQHALDLYQSYLRMYGSEKRVEIERHVENLKKAIEHDKEIANAPPPTIEPTTDPPPTIEPTADPWAELAPDPWAEPGDARSKQTPKGKRNVLNAPPPKEDTKTFGLAGESQPKQPLTRRPWFWVAVGSGVVVAVVIVLLVAGGGESAR